MKTNIKLLVAFVASAMFVACQEPVEVPPTTTSIGIHSVSATFLKGPLSTNKLAVFTATVESLEEDIVIPIPWFYPEDSKNQITDITEMRVTATMDYNCFLEPGLCVLDLTKENHFTYTDGRGDVHDIVIRGEIRKLPYKQILDFQVLDPSLITIIDEEKKEINISYTDATEPLIGECVVDYTLSPHATCSLDGVEKVDLTTLKEVVVTAHDGTTQTYAVKAKNSTPKKIVYGYSAGSEKMLWELEMEGLGIPCVEVNNQSLAVVGKYLVVCPGTGDAPICLNKTTGKKEMTMSLSGGVEAGYVCNDDAGNLLISNHTDATFCIWKTNDATVAPELLLTYDNQTGYPLGGTVKVQGDINGDALIVAPLEGTKVGGWVNSFVYWTITDGVVGEGVLQEVSGFRPSGGDWAIGRWYSLTESALAFTPLGTRIEDGMLLTSYDENVLWYMDGTTFTCSKLLDAYTTFSNAPINRSLSAKHFNNARYVALLAVGAWPAWAVNTYIYLYDMTSLAGMSGTIENTTALMLAQEPTSFYEQGGGTGGNIAPVGDVILVPSSDGYYMSLYAIGNNDRVVVGYQVDCIDHEDSEE
ncbi:MAG: DUF5018 domain-containing protein [Tidjanibacter sp.]|nr:DUF5018 domain-containing protein [Tidjanibacter sp.]